MNSPSFIKTWRPGYRKNGGMANKQKAPARRPPGRPRHSDGQVTAQRLPDPAAAACVAQGHRDYADRFVGALSGSDPNPQATTKVVFLLLLGLCHFDDVSAIKAPRAAVTERVARMIEMLVPGTAYSR